MNEYTPLSWDRAARGVTARHVTRLHSLNERGVTRGDNAASTYPVSCVRPDHELVAPVPGAYTRPLFGSTERFLWDRGCTSGLFRGCLGGVKWYLGEFRVYFVSETAQDELKSARV